MSVTDAVRSSLVAGSGNHTVVGAKGNFGVLTECFSVGQLGNPGPYAEDADRVYWQSAVFHSRDHCMHCHRNNTV